MNYNKITVYDKLKHLVGFKQPNDTSNYIALKSDLEITDSGLYYNNVHQLLTAENIQLNAPNFNDFARETSVELSDWYENLKKDAILQAVSSVFQSRKDKLLTKDIKVSDNLAFDTNELTTYEKIDSAIDKVGVLIRPVISRNAKITINKIGIRLEGIASDETIKMYFETSTGNVIAESDDIVVSNGFNWISVNKEIYLSEGLENNEIFCYIKLSELSKTPNQISYLSKDNRYLVVYPQSRDANINTQLSYYPFDLELSVGCDFTNMIVNNYTSFEEVIRLQVAVRLLEMMFNSSRDNGMHDRNYDLAKYELEGVDNEMSLRKQLDRAINNTYLDFSMLDSFCLPCAKKRRIRIKAV